MIAEIKENRENVVEGDEVLSYWETHHLEHKENMKILWAMLAEVQAIKVYPNLVSSQELKAMMYSLAHKKYKNLN